MMVLDPIIIATTGLEGPNNASAFSSRELSIATWLFYVFDDRLDSDGGHGAVVYLPNGQPVVKTSEQDIFDAMLAVFSIKELED